MNSEEVSLTITFCPLIFTRSEVSEAGLLKVVSATNGIIPYLKCLVNSKTENCLLYFALVSLLKGGEKEAEREGIDAKT